MINTPATWKVTLVEFNTGAWGRTLVGNPQRTNGANIFYDNLPIHLARGLFDNNGIVDNNKVNNLFTNKAQEVIAGIVRSYPLLNDVDFNLLQEEPTRKFLRWAVYATINFAIENSFSERRTPNSVAVGSITIDAPLTNWVTSADIKGMKAWNYIMLSKIYRYKYDRTTQKLTYEGNPLSVSFKTGEEIANVEIDTDKDTSLLSQGELKKLAIIADGSITKAKLADDVVDIHNDQNARLNASEARIRSFDTITRTNLQKTTANLNNIQTNTNNIVTNRNNIVTNTQGLATNTAKITTLENRPSDGVSLAQASATAKRAADQVRHEIGLNPTKAFHDFSTLGISTSSIIQDYDDNSKTSEYGIFNAILSKMKNLKLEEFAVRGKLDDTNNALFSLFFKQVLNKTNGDFNKANFNTFNNTAFLLAIFIWDLSNNSGGLAFYIQDPTKYSGPPFTTMAVLKDKNGNWANPGVMISDTADRLLGKYHEYVDEREMFIQHKNGTKINSIKEWKEIESTGLKHTGYLLAANYNSANNLFNYTGIDNDEVISLVTNRNAGTNFPFDLTLAKNLPGGWFEYKFYASFTGLGRKYDITFPDWITTGNQDGKQGNSNVGAENWRNNANGKAISNVHLDYKTRITFDIRNNGTRIEVEWSLRSTPPDLNTTGGAYSYAGGFIAGKRNALSDKVIDKNIRIHVVPKFPNTTKPTLSEAFVTWRRKVSA